MNELKIPHTIPEEVSNLFNPAFCGVLIHQIVVGYKKESGNDIPYFLLFIIFPILMHKPTRDLLPKTLATKLHPWIQDHQEVKIGFEKRVKTMNKYVRNAIVFGLQQQILVLKENGEIKANELKLKNIDKESSEASACIVKALMVGRWFGIAGDLSTVVALWNIKTLKN